MGVCSDKETGNIDFYFPLLTFKSELSLFFPSIYSVGIIKQDIFPQ